MHIIKSIEHGSIAEELGIQPGDALLTVNGNQIHDKLDYMFLTSDEVYTIEIQSPDRNIICYEIENDYDEDLGLVFETSLMDKPRACSNKCIFCFIDQLPKGMRKTLYFKDDDSRLSFLQGNYITLTNLSDCDIDRIIKLQISPVNVSVHTTDPDLRIKMLHNKTAGNVLDRMKQLADGGIYMDSQIVLCKGINDGIRLDKTISDLLELSPFVSSVSVVPVGISKYRNGLYPLLPFEREDCREVIRQIEAWQDKALNKTHSRFVYPSDEFFLTAEIAIPQASYYDGFPQIENGVGLIASLDEEINFALSDIPVRPVRKTVSIATGLAAYDFILSVAIRISEHFEGLKINVYPITNNFFGEKITVAGLICGVDLISELKDKDLGETLYISDSMLRADDVVLLDDTTISDLETALNVPVRTIKNDGNDFVNKIIAM